MSGKIFQNSTDEIQDFLQFHNRMNNGKKLKNLLKDSEEKYEPVAPLRFFDNEKNNYYTMVKTNGSYAQTIFKWDKEQEYKD